VRLASFDGLEAAVDWFSSDSVALQFDGNDLVHVTDIDRDTGDATVYVFSSSHPDATVLFTGRVNVLERAGTPDDDDETEVS